MVYSLRILLFGLSLCIIGTASAENKAPAIIQSTIRNNRTKLATYSNQNDEKPRYISIPKLTNSMRLQNYSNTSSDYFLIINILKDMNILEYYLNKIEKNSTSLPGKFHNLTELNTSQNLKHNKAKKAFVTYLSVFYSSEDKLNCTQSSSNASLYACSDNLLEAKLGDKLAYLYSIQIQPLYILKKKINCQKVSENSSGSHCKLTTKRLTSRRKLKWKVLLQMKKPTLEPRSNLFSHDELSNEHIKQVATVSFNSHLLKRDPTIKKESKNYGATEFISNNKITLIIIALSIAILIVVTNSALCLCIKRKKIKPLSINNLTTSINNRLLQNYLDISLVSDSKASANTFPKSLKTEKSSYRGPTPLRSSTSVENYASSKPTLSNKANFTDLSTFSLNQIERYSHNDTLNNGHNPYNSLSCMSEKLKTFVSAPRKLKYSVSSVGTQANMSKSTIKELNEKGYYIKKPDIYSDIESQIICMEMEKNNVVMNQTSNDEYISVMDLYNLANKHIDQSASVKVNDYSAFKNSLNFQLQAAKAAAIAESKEYLNELSQTSFKDAKIPGNKEGIKMSQSMHITDKAKSSFPQLSECSSHKLLKSICLNSNINESSASSLAPYSSASLLFSENPTTESSSSGQISQSVSESSNNQTKWSSLNNTEQTDLTKGSSSFQNISSISKNVYPNDLYMAIDSNDWLNSIVSPKSYRLNKSDFNQKTSPKTKKNSSLNSLYKKTSNKRSDIEFKEFYKPIDTFSYKVNNESSSETFEKNSDLWTTVSVSTSSPSLSDVSDHNKVVICNTIKKQLSKRNTSILSNKRDIKSTCQQYQKLYKLNRNSPSKSFGKRM